MSQEVKMHQEQLRIGPEFIPGLESVFPSPQYRFAHELFAEHAARTPEKLAVVCQGSELSYGELNARANQLAASLRLRSVGPNTLVGILVERSLEMVIGILGVLKAGGAYVPLDPAYPKERLQFMIADSQPTLFLTQRHLLAHLPGRESSTLLLDAIPNALSKDSTEDPTLQCSASNLAYVIYTSGSTGKPKGVMLTHGNLGCYVHSMRSAIGVRP